MLEQIIQYLCCPNCRSTGFDLVLKPISRDQHGHVEEGLLLCTAKGCWFPISDGVLELVSGPLADAELLETFAQRHRAFIQSLGSNGLTIHPHQRSSVMKDGFEQQLKQRTHFDWYAENETQSYLEYQKMLFWRLFDDRVLRNWKNYLPDNSLILDLACGDGRCAFGFVNDNRVLACDISRKQIKNAIRKSIKNGLSNKTFFFVADALMPPVKSAAFDAVTCYGALHHLPDPERAFVNAADTLKSGGHLLAAEPNLSFFRPIFDLLMRLFPIWYEEANDDPLISQKMIYDWEKSASVTTSISTSIFAPPHIFSFLGDNRGAWLFDFSEWVGSNLPFVKNNGGIILIHAQRK
jgi:SAM-dependent methyltransferase/uncharacterized protein YbaR (Trm112 family)